MKYSITISADTMEGLRSAIAEALGSTQVATAATAATAAPATTKAKPAAAEKPAAINRGDEPAVVPAAPAGPSREQVKDALKAYAALNGKDDAIKVLKDNGASSIGELAEDKFQAVLAAIS